MTHGEWVATTSETLRRHGVPRPRLDAELLLAHVLGADRSALYLGSDRSLGPPERQRLRDLVARRGQQRIPLAYLLTRPDLYLFGQPEWFDYGVEGAWYAMVIDLVVRCGLVLYRFSHGGWKKIVV